MHDTPGTLSVSQPKDGTHTWRCSKSGALGEACNPLKQGQEMLVSRSPREARRGGCADQGCPRPRVGLHKGRPVLGKKPLSAQQAATSVYPSPAMGLKP